jgi:hypothetical protein
MSTHKLSPLQARTLALPEEVKGIVELERRLAALEAAVGPLLAADVSDPLEKARLQLTLGHAAAALFVTSLRCRGTSVDGEHPARAALERVNRYMRTAAEHEPARPRTAVLDRAAANRFVSAALSRGDCALPGAAEHAPAATPPG